MEENDKKFDTELDENPELDTLEEKDGVKYETNDNWQFEAEAPTLSDDIVLTDEYSIDAKELDVEAPAQVQESAAVNKQIVVDRDKLNFILLAILTAAIIAVLVFLGIRFNTVPNGKEGKLMNPAAVVATVDDAKISVGMFNYYYATIVGRYEQNAASVGLDTSSDYKSQYTTDEDGNQISWQDYFEKITLEQIKTIVAYYNAGVKAGITLNEKQQKAIDDYIESYKTSASAEAVSLNEYLSRSYGDYFTEDTFRTFLEHFIIGASYQGSYRAQQVITDEEIEEYLNKNLNDYRDINYCFVAVPYDTTDDESTAKSQAVVDDYMGRITDKKSMLALVPELYSDYIKEDVAAAMESDSLLTEEEATKQAIDTYSQSVDGTVSGGSSPFGEEINDWLYSDKTPIGAKTYYVDNSIGYAYIILKTEEPTLMDTPTYAVRHILIQPVADNEEDQNNCKFTDEQWAAAKEKADAIYEQFNSGDKSELSFAQLSELNNEDTASVTAGLSGNYGGLYEGITEGSMQKEFEDWSLDSSRSYGDTDIVKTIYGYHIMFFVYQQPICNAEIIYQIMNDRALDSVADIEIKEHRSVLDKSVEKFYKNRAQSTAE